MKIVTSDQMANIDKYAIEKMDVSGEQLMETAGRIAADAAVSFLAKKSGRSKVVVFSGKGNNGGDSFVAARYLMEHNIDTKVLLLYEPDCFKGDVALNFKRLAGLYPQTLIHAESLEKLLACKKVVEDAHLLVDGIFGTGIKGVPKGHCAEAIFFINGFDKPVLSIDIPSGVNGTSGVVEKMAVKADCTVTFGLPKRGLLFNDGPKYTGKLKVVDIGLPEEAVRQIETDLFYLQFKDLKKMFPKREPDSHKMTFGHLFVAAGSLGLTGAGMLACETALRAGCGMVSLGCPESLNPIFETALREIITIPLPETDSCTIDKNAVAKILAVTKDRNCKAILLGPGLGRHQRTTELVIDIIRRSPCPLIIDADALNALAECKLNVLVQASIPIIITPHPGELSRLLGVSTKKIQSDRYKYVKSASKKFNVITVLKGKYTLVSVPGSFTYLNPTGNSGLATAGSGDVLAGMIGSFLAQGMSQADAACCGVYLHGKTADYIARFRGERSLIASDLIKYLPDILR